jgi:multidrug efflux pump subunit AcrA (membrane-fusion protein)
MRLSSKQKILLFSILSLIIAVGLCFVIHKAIKKKPVIVKLKVQKQTIKNVIDISGNISAANSQKLMASSNSIVEQVFVKEGDFVRKGMPLVWMDSLEEDYNLKVVDHNIEEQRINGSKKKLELLIAERKVKEKKLQDKQIFARFDGIVASLDCNPGDYFEQGSSYFGELIDRSYLEAVVEILEDDVQKLKIGQRVIFSFPAIEDEQIEGYVKSYPAVGEITDRGATIVKANIRIDNPPDNLLPGYSFTGEIYVNEPEEILTLKNEGIMFKKGETFAERYTEKGDTELVPVTVEPLTKGIVKILSGLEKGDEVKAQREAPTKNKRRGGGMPPRR